MRKLIHFFHQLRCKHDLEFIREKLRWGDDTGWGDGRVVGLPASMSARSAAMFIRWISKKEKSHEQKF